GSVDSRERHPSVVYAAGGSFPIALTVTDRVHGRRTTTAGGPIVVDPVEAGFTLSPRRGTAPLTVSFTDTSAGQPIAWQWDFDGDGVVDSRLQHPSFTFGRPGSYSVTLTVANAANQDSIVVAD